MSVKNVLNHVHERIVGRNCRRAPFDFPKVRPDTMTTQIVFLIIAGLIVAAGLIGLVLPAFPGAILIFLGFLLAAWAEGFTHVGFGTLSALGVMALLIYAVDFIAGALGAKRFGASTRAIVGASMGAVVGLFFGIPGVLLGPFIGAVLGELSVQRNLIAAGKAGIGTTIGLALGVAAKLAVALSMIGLFMVIRFM
jgi:uncharacterized protein YqgC (DUF456 family)